MKKFKITGRAEKPFILELDLCLYYACIFVGWMNRTSYRALLQLSFLICKIGIVVSEIKGDSFKASSFICGIICMQRMYSPKLLQSCPTLCDPIDGGPPGSPIPGILQARTLEWVAISFSNAGKWQLKWKSLSCVRLFATPWTAAYQAPLSMGFSRQEYWSGVPLPSPKECISFHNFPV